MKVDKTVKRETLYVLVGTVILSILMESFFLIFNVFDYTVFFGNILGGSVAVLNFFLMGLTLQKSLADTDAEVAKKRVKVSQSFRFMMLILVAVLGGVVTYFNIIAVLIPFFFPRIVMIIRGLKIKNNPLPNEKTSEEDLSPPHEGGDNE